MSRVTMRRCDACLCTESKDDPRIPWYRIELLECGPYDVCGGCQLIPLRTIVNTIADNIKKGFVTEPQAGKDH